MVSINNQNVKQAEAQFRQAQRWWSANHANYYPTIGSTPSITQTDTGKNSGRGSAEPARPFRCPSTATWEPDLWGRVRLSVENAVGQRAGERGRSGEYAAERSRRCWRPIIFCWRRRTCSRRCCTTRSRLPEEPAADHQPLQRRRGVEERRHSGADAARGRAGAEHRSARRARAGRARHRHADRPGRPRRSRSAPPRSTPRRRPFRWPFPRSCSSGVPTSRRTSARWRRPTPTSASPQTAYYPTLTLSASAGFLAHEPGESVHLASRTWSAGPVAVSDAVRLRPPRRRRCRTRRPPTMPRSPPTGRPFSAAFQEVEDDLAISALSGRRSRAAAGGRGGRPGVARVSKSTATRRERIPI